MDLERLFLVLPLFDSRRFGLGFAGLCGYGRDFEGWRGFAFCHTEAGGVGGVDGLGYLADVFTGIAFGADGVDVDVGLVFGGKAEFSFLEMEDLRLQEAGDGAIPIHGGLRRGGYFDDGHKFPLIFDLCLYP
jgi:hypothetical protein